MIKFSLTLIGILFLWNASAQPQELVAQTEERTVKQEYVPQTYLSMQTNWSLTTRSLTENKGVYGDPLGERANERSVHRWSYSLGYLFDLNQYLAFESGLAVIRNGEAYSYNDPLSDSAYGYATTYSFLALPVGLQFGVGKHVRFTAGCGIIPQLAATYRQDIIWTTAIKNSSSETVKQPIATKLNSFVSSVYVKCGIHFHGQGVWGLVLEPQMRLQLTSSYQSLDSFIHKTRAIGLTLGLIRKL